MNHRVRLAALGLGMLAAAAASRGGSAQAGVMLNPQALGCQTALGKASLGLKASYTKAFSKYLNAELKAPGSGDVAARDAAISKAIGKFDAAIIKKCDPALLGMDVLNTAPPNGIGFQVGTCGKLWGESAPEEPYEMACAALPTGTMAEKNACWRCFIIGELREWLQAHYPWKDALIPAGSDLCGVAIAPPPTPDSTMLKCLTTIPKLANALLLGVEKNTEACLNNIRKGKIEELGCPNLKGIATIQKLKDKLTAGAATACAASGFPAWRTECWEEDTGGTCPGPAISDVATITSCTNGNGADVPNGITCALYPGAADDGVECPPVCGDGSNSPSEPCDPSAPSAGWKQCGPDFTCSATCNCACPTRIDFADIASDPASVLDTGWTGISHRAPIISGGDVTVALSCTATERPCGTCTVSGPIANVGALKLRNHRCTGDTSVQCTTTVPDCNVAGGTCEFYFGGPLPLAAGGVSTCVFNRFNGSVSGTADVETGEAANSANLSAAVYTGIAIDNPCARCSGDATPNDNVQGGTCSGGARNGLACDANGSVPGRPDFGSTSLDCPSLPGALIATLPIDLTNATDPVVKTLDGSSPPCSGEPGERCLCDTCNNINQEPCDHDADCPDPPGPIGPICSGKRCIGGTNAGAACTASSECPSGGICGRPGEPTKPSSCLDDTNTPGALDCSDTTPVDGEGECLVGPITTQCSVVSGHAQRGCIIDADCGGTVGSCESANRLCFPTGGFSGKNGTNTLIADGMEDTPMGDASTPTLGAVFCVGPTGSAAVNNVAGIPGPGRVTIRGNASGHP